MTYNLFYKSQEMCKHETSLLEKIVSIPVFQNSAIVPGRKLETVLLILLRDMHI